MSKREETVLIKHISDNISAYFCNSHILRILKQSHSFDKKYFRISDDIHIQKKAENGERILQNFTLEFWHFFNNLVCWAYLWPFEVECLAAEVSTKKLAKYLKKKDQQPAICSHKCTKVYLGCVGKGKFCRIKRDYWPQPFFVSVNLLLASNMQRKDLQTFLIKPHFFQKYVQKEFESFSDLKESDRAC